MATIHTTYLGDLRTEATHLQSGEKIITDAPTDNNGKGEAFSPTDLVAASLASCMLTIMGIAAQNHGFNIKGTNADITKTMMSDPRRIGHIEINLYFPPHPYTPKEKKILEVSAFTCPVFQSLHPEMQKSIHLHFSEQ
jgi:uncharacterized OsmC-like protein